MSWRNVCILSLPNSKITSILQTKPLPIGLAIDVPKQGENVTQDSIDKYHSIYLKELEDLFERHKHEAGYGKRQLKII